jgi:translation initiation factor 5B
LIHVLFNFNFIGTEWKKNPNAPIQETLKKQLNTTLSHFEERVKLTIGYFAEQGLNACLYYQNKDFSNYVSLVPTSAHTGEGIIILLYKRNT